MAEQLTESPVNGCEAVIMRAVRLAYRLGRQDQQRFVEVACCKHLDDIPLALLLHGLACDFPHEPASFDSIIRAVEYDSANGNDGKP